MHTAAKTSLTLLMKSFRLKLNWQNIWRKNNDPNISNNSPSNYFKIILNSKVIYKRITDLDQTVIYSQK